MKYYAVANGRSKGVYNSWGECQSQVNGYSNARFKSFTSKAAADAFVASQGQSSGGSYGGSSYSGTTGSSWGSSRSSSQPYSSYGNRSASTTRSSNGGYYGGSSTYSGDGGSSLSTGRGSYSTNGSTRSSSTSSRSSGSSSSGRQVVYTDGSSLGNGRTSARAGWGVYWENSSPKNKYGPVTSGPQTNNRGELQAVCEALRQIEGTEGSYEIRADSKYAIDSIVNWGDRWENNGWKTARGTSVENQDLIREARSSISRLRESGIDVSLTHVKGHATSEGNNAADELAKRGAQG